MSPKIKTSAITLPNPGTSTHPFWSVMIPAYNPPENYLEQALRSVLLQDPGLEQMQIEVVDDCSPQVDVASLVRKIAGERVKVSRTPKNLGLAGCWNMCIERAQGEWVHILHQDDLVLPGFYQKLRPGLLATPLAGAAFCRTVQINELSARGDTTPELRETPGIVDALAEKLSCWQVIQFAAMIVRRDVYQKIGPFDARLEYVIDWDMWLRIARQYPVWHEPSVLAGYRLHGSTETSRLKINGGDVKEVRAFLKQTAPTLNDLVSRKEHARAVQWYAQLAVGVGGVMFYQRRFKGAWNQIAGGIRLSPSFPVFIQISRLVGDIISAGVRKLITGSGAKIAR